MALWTFPTTAPGGDERRLLPVFSLSPNWKGGVLERLEWLTDVMSSEIAAEQRRAARRYPRRSFEAGFMRVDSQRSRLDVFMAGIGRKPFLVPLWHEQFKLGEPNASPGVVQFPAGTLAQREFAFNDLVMIGTPERYAILTVRALNLNADQMLLAVPASVGTWPAGSRITPLRKARNVDATALSNRTDRVGISQLRFTLTDADSRFPASWGYCSPLWRFKPDRATDIGVTYDRSAFMLDMGAGLVEITDPGNRAQITTSMGLTLFGREQVAKYRAFLYMARGRARRFYVPSYTKDIVPIENLGGPTFDATVNGFSQYMDAPQEARRIVSVVFKDGRPEIYRDIVGITPIFSPVVPNPQVAERFQVEPDFPPVLAREIERIQFIVPSRFDQDSFEILHVTDDSAAIKAAVAVKSSIVEGMPPIECWVTSRPYPVVSRDSLNMTAAVLGGTFKDVRDLGMLDTTGIVYDSELVSVLGGYDVPADSMDLLATVSDSDLKEVLVVYDNYAPEEMNMQAAVVGGTLKIILIPYEMIDESIDISGAVLGGTLS